MGTDHSTAGRRPAKQWIQRWATALGIDMSGGQRRPATSAGAACCIRPAGGFAATRSVDHEYVLRDCDSGRRDFWRPRRSIRPMATAWRRYIAAAGGPRHRLIRVRQDPVDQVLLGGDVTCSSMERREAIRDRRPTPIADRRRRNGSHCVPRAFRRRAPTPSATCAQPIWSRLTATRTVEDFAFAKHAESWGLRARDSRGG